MKRKRWALISVTDKSNLVEFASSLQNKQGYEILSSSGTAKVLEDAGLRVTPVQSVTGNPEAFGGRMKTISFQLASALLYRRDHPQDQQEAADLEIIDIDLVVCNLYPFKSVVERGGSEDELIENIDIGGPLMLRAAAKNYKDVTVLVDPKDYSNYLQELEKEESPSLEFKKMAALKVWEHIADYDLAIASELGSRWSQKPLLQISLKPHQQLRYGENPHQSSTFYALNPNMGFGASKTLQGKELSYNNLLDADAALKSVSELKHLFPKNESAVVVKHGNPCGLAVGPNLKAAFDGAWAGDPISRFGGILAFSSKVTEEIAQSLSEVFIEVVIAPEFSDEALTLFANKKNLRLIQMPLKQKDEKESTLRSVFGGVLIQQEDNKISHEIKSVTNTPFPDQKLPLAQFGLVAAKYLKSNAIALVGELPEHVFALLGGGAGQPNRIESFCDLAWKRQQMNFKLDPSHLVLVSDAFFPFTDMIEESVKRGIRFIIQPGGSLRDNEVIQKCNDHQVAMAFTNQRHFRH